MEQLKKHFSFGTKLVLALAMLFTMAVIFSCEDNPTDPNTVATPTFSPAAGLYDNAQTVTISCATIDADIYYTTDGTTPTDASTEYTAPITVGSSKTIKAIAYKTGLVTSEVATAEYEINISFNTWAAYQTYMAGKDWAIMVDKGLETATDLMLVISFPANYAPHDVTSADNFTLTVEGMNIPLAVNAGVVSTVPQYVTVPKTTTDIDVLFKRNNVVVINKNVKIAPNPADLTCEQNPNLTAAIPASWTLGRNCSVQLFSMKVYGSGREDEDLYDVTINPADRSHTIPANALSVVAPILDGEVAVDEALITESNNSVVVSSSYVTKDLYGTTKNVKKAHRNRF